MTTQSEFEACPFCGKPAHSVVAESKTIYVTCADKACAAYVLIAEPEAWNRRSLPCPPPFRAAGDEARDAARYRWLRGKTSGGRKYNWSDSQEFVLPRIEPVSDIMKGSVAQHLDAAIDAALDAAMGREDGK